ncbi:MAG TPA: DUF2460 domain-containing protein [Sphingomicrobium sp.]|nr:DUF2460 domain-containing protein [Sphingomicrobium sp.]
MNLWFTRGDAKIVQTFVKRFDPLHWTVDFPRGTIASAVTTADGHGLSVQCEFLREGDLVGVIWESVDTHAHPAHARETNRDYSNCTLSFHWESGGVIALDAVNGPTLTIEGTDSGGNAQIWLVRLWNYATGTPESADVMLDFNALDGGFSLPADAVRVDPTRIDRMFISLVAPGYVTDSQALFPAPVPGSATISNITCDGASSVLLVNDAVVPEHQLRIATGYDDMYNLPPERVIQSIERLGYRGVINHYIGMSHYFALDGSGLLDPARTLNSAALAWHQEFARSAKAHEYEVVWSISYEILDMFCPDAWKQRAPDGTQALTAWVPPSTLVSPANPAPIAFLKSIAATFVGIAQGAGLQPQVQIGEPWWWVTPSRAICLYDVAAKAALGGNPVLIEDVRGPLTAAQLQLLDDAGALLAASTSAICAAVKQASTSATTLLLVYLPTALDPRAPELKRADLPPAWARPAFDVLQTEDYEWVTAGRSAVRANAYSEVDARLGYPVSEQQYFAGFVADAVDREQWRPIVGAAIEARARGCAEVFVWALPQVIRDGVTLFGEEEAVTPFDDVLFPIEIGQQASVAPTFSTNIVTSASGFEARNANWAQARLRFDAGPGVRGEAELETLLSFFRARRGPAVAFRFRDPYDNSSNGMTGTPAATDQAIGTGDGATDSFELVKAYGTGEQRRITRPVAGTVRIATNAMELTTGWTLDDKGVIRFDSPPAAGSAITAGFLFDTPVRFAEDNVEVNRSTFLAGEAPSVPLIEVRED